MFQRNFHAHTFENVFMFFPQQGSLRKVSHAAQKLMSPLFFSSNRPCCTAEPCRKKVLISSPLFFRLLKSSIQYKITNCNFSPPDNISIRKFEGINVLFSYNYFQVKVCSFKKLLKYFNVFLSTCAHSFNQGGKNGKVGKTTVCSPTFEPDPLLPFDITKSVKNIPPKKAKFSEEPLSQACMCYRWQAQNN